LATDARERDCEDLGAPRAALSAAHALRYCSERCRCSAQARQRFGSAMRLAPGKVPTAATVEVE
jgi:hypothetical protein